MSLELPNDNDMRDTQTGAWDRQIRPALLAILIFVLATGGAAAAKTALDPSIEKEPEASQEAQHMETPDVSNQSVLSESQEAENNGDGGSPQQEGVASEGQSNSGATTSIRIETHSSTTANGESGGNAPGVTVNGESVELPRSGTYRQDIKDGDSRTRIRARVQSDGTSLNISTNESMETGSD